MASGSQFSNQDWTRTPCIGSVESLTAGPWGSPSSYLSPQSECWLSTFKVQCFSCLQMVPQLFPNLYVWSRLPPTPCPSSHSFLLNEPFVFLAYSARIFFMPPLLLEQLLVHQISAPKSLFKSHFSQWSLPEITHPLTCPTYELNPSGSNLNCFWYYTTVRFTIFNDTTENVNPDKQHNLKVGFLDIYLY